MRLRLINAASQANHVAVPADHLRLLASQSSDFPNQFHSRAGRHQHLTSLTTTSFATQITATRVVCENPPTSSPTPQPTTLHYRTSQIWPKSPLSPPSPCRSTPSPSLPMATTRRRALPMAPPPTARLSPSSMTLPTSTSSTSCSTPGLSGSPSRQAASRTGTSS